MAGLSERQAIGDANNFKYNGKELQTKEFTTGSGLEWYDYGARMFDQQFERLFNQDKFSEVYIALSPYQCAANNPIKIIDEGGELLKDKEGRIIATSTGNIVSRDNFTTVNGVEYQYKSTYEVVTIYTDKGTPINALREIASEVTRGDGAGGRLKVEGADNPMSTCSNCHGYAFAGAQLVIEDNSNGSSIIKTILADDGYQIDGEDGATVDDMEATGFIETDESGRNIYHTAIRNNNDFWSADHGVFKPIENVSKGQVASPAAKNSFVRTKNIKNNDPLKGTATGIKIVDPKEIAKILKDLGLSTTKSN